MLQTQSMKNVENKQHSVSRELRAAIAPLIILGDWSILSVLTTRRCLLSVTIGGASRGLVPEGAGRRPSGVNFPDAEEDRRRGPQCLIYDCSSDGNWSHHGSTSSFR